MNAVTEDSDFSKEDDIIEAVYGSKKGEHFSITSSDILRNSFAPWHHPVKQIVRERQWASLTQKLLDDSPKAKGEALTYFTLPGADLLDVRVLVDVVGKKDLKIEYFGFDIGYKDTQGAEAQEENVYFSAEAALRQAGVISDNAEILSDRLEDIALLGSQAQNRLKQKSAFDVINIDACNHLAFIPEGKSTSLFDALERLLAHQLKSDRPWLLFLTTRANPEQLEPLPLRLGHTRRSRMRRDSCGIRPV